MLCGIGISLQAQTPVTIQDIQTKDPVDLANCLDEPNFLGDTVSVRGITMMAGNLAQSTGGQRRQFWIQSGYGPNSGINIRNADASAPTTPDDIWDLVPGDSVEIIATVGYYQGQSQLEPIAVNLITPTTDTITSQLIDIGDLQDANSNNIIPTGEQWEGMFVEIQDVTVTAVSNFTSGGLDRVSFEVVDNNGKRMTIYDTFLAQRLPQSGGTFTAPIPGTVYTSIKGVIGHAGNDCISGGAFNTGYRLLPFAEDHYKIGASGAIISGITRTPTAPTSSQDVTVSAVIADPDGLVVSASLFYAIGITNNTYTEVSMTNTSGMTYDAIIPSSAFSDGDFVKYYVSATDDSTLVTNSPNVPGGTIDPLFFRVRDAGLTISDIQFTPYSNGNSGYVGLEVTVDGIVTASVDDLGFVHIQEENSTSGWSAIALVGNTDLSTKKTGDKVTVTGIVEESFGFTRINNISMVPTTGTGTVTPVEFAPGVFQSYSVTTNEQYESMLITLKDPNGPLYVVNDNADGPNNNFGEFRVGFNEFLPDSGCRVLTGRADANASSSLNVSYINDSMWIDNSGGLNVDACIVTQGDTMDAVTGIMYYSFGAMKLLPRNNADFDNFRGENCSANSTAIEDDLAGSRVNIYPNPAQDYVNVEYQFPIHVQGAMQMRDMLGRVVLQREIKGVEGNLSVPTHELSQGTYLMSVIVEGVPVAMEKIMILK